MLDMPRTNPGGDEILVHVRFQAVFLLVLLGWIFLPVYIASGVSVAMCE